MLGTSLIKKFYTYRAKKRLKKQEAKILRFLRDLYSFVNWLNKNMNRHQRKQFWSSVLKGQPLLEQTLKNLISKYEKKEKKESANKN